MGSSKRLAALYDMYADEKALARIAKTAGPLQTLSSEELELERMPVTVYPKPQGVRAWVRFGPQHVRVGALLMRTTETAAGIEFTHRGENLPVLGVGQRGHDGRGRSYDY
ncbi:hypothetical protein GCM10007269_27620 [Microbacterium murale]|uniref:Uncharacterized protein n=1 Tax=Microbacterium murale TaxID=1081040 RepID=A0ABQ1RUU1_9MICO|nr:hypothetical protein GCM10007269_27620 [Microbacterium murale]